MADELEFVFGRGSLGVMERVMAWTLMGWMY